MKIPFLPPAAHSRLLAIVGMFLLVSNASAATVQYQGRLSDEFLEGPADGRFVIAGVFAPSFDPFRYKYVYGVDEVGNMSSPNYSRAVADGNFIPIGTGGLTSSDGEFGGTGVIDGMEGSRVFIFGFGLSDPDRSTTLVLGTSSNPSWLLRSPVGPQSLFLDAAAADIFVFGRRMGDSLELQGLPIPEPSILALVIFAAGWWWFLTASRPSSRPKRRSIP